ncbi:hypothetical protein GCM10008985_03820 [Halococcus dombrowskii]
MMIIVVLSTVMIVLTPVVSAGGAAAPLMNDTAAKQNNSTEETTPEPSTPSTPSTSTTSGSTETSEELFTGNSSTTDTGSVAGTPSQQAETQNTSKSVLTISGTGSYDFRVVGNLSGAQTGSEDLVSEYRARGTVNGSERDIYVFDYGLMEFDSNGSVQVTLNGNPIDQQVLNGHRLAVYKDPPETENGSVEYEITVSGSIAPSALGNQTQIVNSNTARGSLDPYDGITAFYYTGEITQFDIVGDAQVTLDNERVEPDEVTEVATATATTQPQSSGADAASSQDSGPDSDSASEPGQRDTRASVGAEATTAGETAASSGSGPGFGLGAAAGALVLSLAVIAVRRRL